MLKKVVGLAAVVAICVGASTSAARADAPADVFSGVGVFVDNPQDFPDPQTVATELQANHFTWIALHLDDVGTLEWTDPTWIPTMREHGISVGVWGVEGLNPIASAGIADLVLRTWTFDFYIADAEGPYEGKHRSTGWERSAAFVLAFRSLQPTIPAALVTLGAAKAPFVLRSTSAPGATAASICSPRRTSTSTRTTGPTSPWRTPSAPAGRSRSSTR